MDFGGDGGTTSATGLPKRVTRIGLRVLRTSSRMPRHLALNLDMAISFIIESYYGQRPWSNLVITVSRNLFIVKSLVRIEQEIRTVRSLNSKYTFGLAGFVFLVTISGLAQATHDPWLILANGAKGAINIHTTR